jgi:hypothetical protein
MNHRSTTEDILIEAWGEPVEQDRDFSDNPSAQQIYGSATTENVGHFIYPVATDSEGNAYITKRLPLRLFAELYPSLGEGDFEAAIHRAKNAKLDEEGVDTNISGNDPVETEERPEHVEIIRATEKKLS